MPDFSTYQEREERRRALFLTAAAATAVAVAIPGVRKGIVRLGVKGLARAGRRIGSIDPPTRIASSAAELEALLRRGIPQAARFGLGRKKAAEILRDELAQYGSTGLANQAIRVSEEQAERILSTQAYRRFVLQKAETRGLLFDEDIREILEARVRAAQQIAPNLALDQIRLREQQRLLLAFQRSRTAFPGQAAAMGEPVVQNAVEFARQMAVAEYKRQAGGGGLGERIARFFGIEGVQVADPRLAARLGDVRQQLINLGIDPILAGSLPAHGFVQVGNEVVDLTRIRQGVTRVSDWLSQHFQIPLGPGMMGISPTQLFPWLRGHVLRDFAVIESNAKDPALKAILRATGEGIGKDVIQVGRRFLVADFEEGTLASLRFEGELRSGLYGYAKRRAEQIVAAEEARATGRRGPWGWLGLGQGYGESFIGRARSIFTKFAPDSTWAPRLFQRLLTGSIDQISPREVRQLGRFLTDQELPEIVKQALLGRAPNLALEPDLLDALQRVGTDQGVVDWFLAATQIGPEGKTPFMHSQAMRELVNHFRTSPRSALARFDPGADLNELLDWNFFGRKPGRTALQQMRDAIFDELESRVQLTGSTADTGFLELIDSLGSLSAKDRQAALAYGQGKLILRRLEERDSLAALDWLRQNQVGQAQIQEYIRRRSRFWHTYDPPEGEGLRTGELFIRRKYGFLEEYNRALKAGATWPGAIWSALRGPWARQYAAFFTGRQEDVTTATLGMEYIPRKLNEMLQDFLGLGLPAQDLRSGGSILAGLLLKRVLPVAVGYEAYRYWDYKSEELGVPGPSDLYANLRSRAGFLRARLFGDRIPLLGRRELFPGLEKILPDRNLEEEAEFQRTGREPVRKGRFWFLGSREEFWGGKIDYFLPSAVAVARSNWQGAENVDLNTRAYWENALLPTPENFFLGPLNPLRDPYWWERRQSMGETADRPYVISGEPFDPNTVHGPLLNATLGRILKPRRVLHPEYLPRDLGGHASREQLRSINEAMKRGLDVRGVGLVVGGGAGGLGDGGAGDQELVSPGVIGGAGTAVGSLGVITPGGQISLISLPMGPDRAELARMGRSTYQPRGHGARLSRREIERINRLTEAGAGGLAGLRPADVLRLSTQTAPFREEDFDLINFESGLIAGARNLTDLAGLYGWMGETALASLGMPLEQRGLTVASPSRAYGFGRRFYDLGLGGLGGPISEVGRRFLTRRPRREEWNPVPNLMPAWLPGPEYFIDFRHGDPYCVSHDTLVETGLLQFLAAGKMSAEMTITTHRGRLLPVRGLAVRPVRPGEKVYSLKLCSLTGVRMEFSEEHPILVCDNPTQRRSYRPTVRAKRYEQANAILELLVAGVVRKKEIAERLGLHLSYLTVLLSMMEGDGKVRRGDKKQPVELLDATPYDIEILRHGLRWIPIRQLAPGQYVAYPRPRIDLRPVWLDLAELTGYPATETWLYPSGRASRADFLAAYEWMEESGVPDFAWGERKRFLEANGWSAKAYETSQEFIRLGRTPERVNRRVLVDDDLAYAFGLYIAEGWLQHGVVGFALHANEEALFQRACRGLRRLDPNARAVFERVAGTNGAVGRFYSTVAERVLRAVFGAGAHEKTIPDEFAHLPDDQLACFLSGMFDGDGYCFEAGEQGDRYGQGGKQRIGLASCNLGLLLQVRKLLLRWGVVSSVIQKIPSEQPSRINGKEVRTGENWALLVRGVAASQLARRLGYDIPEVSDDTSKHWTFATDDYIFLRVLAVEEVEGVEEVYGFEVDEDDSFCVAGVATHNTKIPRGELRLPGEAYERAHPEVRLMETRASSLGKSVPELMQSMLHLDEPISAFGEAVTEYGDEVHRRLQRRWKRMGVLLGAEQTIYNEELGISGHFDAMLRTSEGVRIAEIKSVGAKRFAQARERPFAEHVSQLNFYLHETGIQRGMLIYVNRDDPTQQFTHQLAFDPAEFHRTVGRVQEARRRLWRMVEQGVISRGDLYDPLTRFEILADVAPYSQQYATLRQYLVAQNKAGQLDERENARFQAAKKRVAQQKKRVQTVPYRFRGLALDRQTFTVKSIIDPNTILVHESGHPIRLAGVRSSQARIEEVLGPAPVGMSLAEWQFAHFGITPGTRITVGLESDPLRRVADDTLQTMHAVVYTGGNLNRRLIEMGIGTEKETDYSDTGVAARFSDFEIWKGKLWEWFAHLDTPFHTKFLRVRSPLEELERSIVFGKSTGSWQHPIRDYVSPTLTSFATRNPVMAGLSLGIFSTFFFKTPQMKKRAFLIGGAIGAALPLLRTASELITGETWKPERTVRREALEEYWDILKYVKYRSMAAVEERLAKEREGVNVERMVRELHRQGERRKARRERLEREKRRLILEGRERNRKQIAAIQDELDRLAQPAGMMKLGPHTTRALQFRELYRSTLYGIDPGTTPFLNLFRAMPKYKRELIQGWIEKSDEQERRRIFQLLPRAEKRVLGRYLGIPEGQIPDRPRLRDYFRNHPLPGPDWIGWSPQVDLEDLRMQAIRHEGLDPFESGIYPVQIDEAEARTENVPIPTLQGTSHDIQNRLNAILSGKGLHNVRVQVDLEPHNGDGDHVQIHMDLKQRREQDIRRALQLS